MTNSPDAVSVREYRHIFLPPTEALADLQSVLNRDDLPRTAVFGGVGVMARTGATGWKGGCDLDILVDCAPRDLPGTVDRLMGALPETMFERQRTNFGFPTHTIPFNDLWWHNRTGYDGIEFFPASAWTLDEFDRRSTAIRQWCLDSASPVRITTTFDMEHGEGVVLYLDTTQDDLRATATVPVAAPGPLLAGKLLGLAYGDTTKLRSGVADIAALVQAGAVSDLQDRLLDQVDADRDAGLVLMQAVSDVAGGAAYNAPNWLEALELDTITDRDLQIGVPSPRELESALSRIALLDSELRTQLGWFRPDERERARNAVKRTDDHRPARDEAPSSQPSSDDRVARRRQRASVPEAADTGIVDDRLDDGQTPTVDSAIRPDDRGAPDATSRTASEAPAREREPLDPGALSLLDSPGLDTLGRELRDDRC